MPPLKENPVREKSYQFALGSVRLYRVLTSEREYILSRQMVRAATSVGANVEEAIAGQSRRDFAAKMSIASKEARESLYWLRLIRDAELAPESIVGPLIVAAEELVRMITAIVKSTNSRPPPPQD